MRKKQALLLLTLLMIIFTTVTAIGADTPAFPQVPKVPRQPLLSQIHRLTETMEVLGTPFEAEIRDEILALKSETDAANITAGIQKLLDPLCLFSVEIQNSGPPVLSVGSGKRELLEQGWRTFLIKVVNIPGKTRKLLIKSPNAQPLPHAQADQIASRWMQFSLFEGQPMKPNLSGLELEYRIIQIYSRDPGKKQGLFEVTVTGEPGDEGELIREWRFHKDTNGWKVMNESEIAVKDGSLHVTSNGKDPYIGAAVESKGGPMVLRFWGKTAEHGVGQFFWWTKDQPRPDGGRRANFIVEQGKEHLYEIPFTVKGTLAGIRLDPLNRPGKMRIDWVDLYSAQQSANWKKLSLDFQCLPATQVTFRILDAYGKPGFAKFEIRDAKGRIYPSQSKRLAPDFFFHQQIYRGDGERIALPAGDYTIQCSRGPETIPETKTLKVGDQPTELVYRVNRWIDPAKLGWWSGDHHIHAAGCKHYENPTQGVLPEDMMRHIMGEDLKVGCCLTWGPCFDYQKRFFTGKVAEQSRYPYVLRYDVEVSGFGSHKSGHLNLLNLKQQIYPGGESKEHWPTLGLNTLRWAKSQGAICGPAHSSIGLTRFIGRLPNTEGKDGPNGLPHYNIPAYDGIGANEFIMDVTHNVPGPDGTLVPAVDFISAMNTNRTAEWNMWYHVLNCGFQVAVSGETDFPCISGERVGLGRVYAQVDGELTFPKWIQSIATGRSYVSDASCHLLNFAATDHAESKTVHVGKNGSKLNLAEGKKIRFSVSAAIRQEDAKEIPVELIVNGYPVEEKRIPADGELRDLRFETKLEKSGWVAVRVFPHAHSNPIYVSVAGKPIRASADSARWCLRGVEQCWKTKQPTYRAEEQTDAKSAYEHARKVYQTILAEAR